MTRPNNQLRVVLFDLGGVLVELTGIASLRSWTGKRMSTEELWRMWLSSPAVRAFETGQSFPDVFAGQLISELGLPLGRQQFLREFARWAKGLFPGALQLVRRIPPRYIRATLSNTNPLHWPHFMDDMGLDRAFDRHFASHLTGKIKPDADAFIHVIDAIGCEAREVVFLDDNLLNVEAASGVGMRAVRVSGVQEAEQALLDAGIVMTPLA
ncbi:MAG TPA: HAD family phosphatase [Blastocatellia bacterium]|nr:HAD family phosphatase [Blastocatellia bacterium]